MRSSCQRVLFLAVLLLLAAGCSPGAGAEPTPIPAGAELEQPTYTVERGTVVRRLEFSARVAPVQEARPFFRADGYLSRLLVQRGERVREGDLLAELEMANLARQLETARLELEQARIDSSHAVSRTLWTLQEARLALNRAYAVDPSPAVLQAEASLIQSQDGLANAEKLYRDALQRVWEPQERRDAAARQVENAQRSLEIAQANYDDALWERAAELQRLELAVARAELEHETACAGPDPRLAQQVEQLEAQAAERRIVAPFDGVVLSIGVVPGERVEGYQPALVVGDPTALELRADLSAEQLGELVEGQEVAFGLSGRPGETFGSTVRQLPYGWGGDVEESDRAVHLAPGPDAPDLEMNDVARVTAVLEEREGVLWLPPGAIQTFQGRTFAIVQEAGGVQRRVDVVTGIRGADRVEIVSGLEEGMIVVGF
jgi:multidrug efflux pump subunit AcrA (membrane-fusion protein)